MREEISGGDVVIVVVVVAGRDNVKEAGVVFRERKASSTPKFGQLTTTCRLPQATTQTRDDFQRRSLVPAPLFPGAKAPNNLRALYPCPSQLTRVHASTRGTSGGEGKSEAIIPSNLAG